MVTPTGIGERKKVIFHISNILSHQTHTHTHTHTHTQRERREKGLNTAQCEAATVKF